MVLRAILILVIFSLPAKSQVIFTQVGFEGGLTFAKVTGDPILDFFLERDQGLSLGPTVWMPLNKRYSVRSHLFFEQKGAKGIFPLNDEEGDPLGFFQTKIRYNYLTIPLLIEAAWGRKLKLTASMGPYVGIMLNQTTTFTDLVSGDQITDKTMSDYSPWDGGWILGSGLRYNATKRLSLLLDGRLCFGWANVASKPVLYSLDLYQQTAQILLGISYCPSSQSVQNFRTR